MKIAATCALALLAGTATADTSDDKLSLPSAREYFFASAYVQVCSEGAVVDTPALKALREQTAAFYHAQFAQAGEDATTKQIIGKIEANVLPAGLVDAIKRLRVRTVPGKDVVCKTYDAVIRRQLARHDVAMAEQHWPGAKPLAQARSALREFASASEPTPAPGASETVPGKASNLARAARIHIDHVRCPVDYPRAAQEAGVTGGMTTMQFDVDATGRPTAWDLLHSAGDTLQHGLLDFAAIEALSQCPFDPGVDAEGRAVPSRPVIEYVYRLD
jgi:hypothetical protein